MHTSIQAFEIPLYRYEKYRQTQAKDRPRESIERQGQRRAASAPLDADRDDLPAGCAAGGDAAKLHRGEARREPGAAQAGTGPISIIIYYLSILYVFESMISLGL